MNQTFGDCIERTIHDWYHRHIHVPLFFQFSSKVLVLLSLFASFQFIIILLFWERFPSALADGFPLESEWQQISLSLKDSSQYSGRY